MGFFSAYTVLSIIKQEEQRNPGVNIVVKLNYLSEDNVLMYNSPKKYDKDLIIDLTEAQ